MLKHFFKNYIPITIIIILSGVIGYFVDVYILIASILFFIFITYISNEDYKKYKKDDKNIRKKQR